jgi:hypothetical protein
LYFNVAFRLGVINAFVVVVNGYREDFFGGLLTNDVLIQKGLYLLWRVEFNIKSTFLFLIGSFFFYYSVSLKNTLVTNVSVQTSNKQLGLGFGPATKGTI